MKKININDLPKYSPWVERLMGLEPFENVVRSEAKNYEEYNDNKFAEYLAYSRKNPESNFCKIRTLEKRSKSTDTLCISKEGKLFLTSAENALEAERDLLIRALGPLVENSEVVVELGSGYGYNLFLLSKLFSNPRYIGGDFSENAIALSRRLSKDNKKVSVVPFNFYDRNFNIFQFRESGKAVVFTHFSISQLPKALPFFKGIRKYKSKISGVIHFEPIYELYDAADTLGLLRRKYTLLNDYNTDLLSVLKKAKSEVEIVDIKYDIFGVNPLLPTSVIRWRFKNN